MGRCGVSAVLVVKVVDRAVYAFGLLEMADNTLERYINDLQ